jgi:hypothetical protein
MVIAALVSFGILLVAWIFAPGEGSTEPPAVSAEPEALPVAA